MLNEKFVEKIKNPKSEKLKELLCKAEKDVKNILVEVGVNYKELIDYSLSYYYDWKKDNIPPYMFLFQNPGTLQKERHLSKEANEINKRTSCLGKVRVYRKFFQEWLLSKNSDFTRKFFPILRKYNLVNIKGDLSAYIKRGRLFKDFYCTDLVKYRVKTNLIKDGKKKNAEISFEEFVKKELLEIKPKLILVFGSRSWKVIKRRMDVRPINKSSVANVKAITKVHGRLFKGQEILETFMIPLAHFSQQNHFLRDSYFDYLEEGLKKWNKINRREI